MLTARGGAAGGVVADAFYVVGGWNHSFSSLWLAATLGAANIDPASVTLAGAAPATKGNGAPPISVPGICDSHRQTRRPC